MVPVPVVDLPPPHLSRRLSAGGVPTYLAEEDTSINGDADEGGRVSAMPLRQDDRRILSRTEPASERERIGRGEVQRRVTQGVLEMYVRVGGELQRGAEHPGAGPRAAV